MSDSSRLQGVRVRFAPSPTGYLHVGGARTALYNWLFARRHGGTCILRIEDTDVDRSKPELEQAILESLEWLGLKWDEGPYRQSERLERYRSLAADLEHLRVAYPCFCTAEELQAKRAKAEAERRPSKYDGTCRDLTEEQRGRRWAEGRPFALRFRMPKAGATSFDDKVFGHVEVAHQDLEDFVLLRSDGNPTYHLSVVADDLDMRVTHVVRGADHLSNTPKQILMYRALGATEPVFAHLPLILGPDRTRLSKRHGATSVGAYRDEGILPEALVNFLALLGWTPASPASPTLLHSPDHANNDDDDKDTPKEIVSLDEMVRQFDLEAVSRSNAVFDPEKLAWMNSEYLRRLPAERLLPLVEAELKSAGIWQPGLEAPAHGSEDRERFRRTVILLQSRARSVKDFSQSSRAFFAEDFEYDPEAAKKFWKDPGLPDLLTALAERLSNAEPFDPERAEKYLRAFAEEKNVKAGLLINAARVALTGQAVAPGLFDVMAVFGRERVLERLRRAAQYLSLAAGNKP